MDIKYHFEYNKSYSATSLLEELFENKLIIITETANTTDREAKVNFTLYKNFDELLKGLDDLIKDGFAGDIDDLGCYVYNGRVGVTVKSSCDHANDYYYGIIVCGLNENDQKKCFIQIEELLNIKAD